MWRRLVQKIAQHKSSYELSWKAKVINNDNGNACIFSPGGQGCRFRTLSLRCALWPCDLLRQWRRWLGRPRSLSASKNKSKCGTRYARVRWPCPGSKRRGHSDVHERFGPFIDVPASQLGVYNHWRGPFKSCRLRSKTKTFLLPTFGFGGASRFFIARKHPRERSLVLAVNTRKEAEFSSKSVRVRT